MTIELNNSDIDCVGGGLKFPSDIICVYPTLGGKYGPPVYKPSPTYDPNPGGSLKQDLAE
jgi:hypothetical protein